jgi:serine/threonine-protein kinase
MRYAHAVRIAVGTVIASKYKLEAPLARGGMGAVWIARHIQLGSQLALKFLDPRLAVSPSFVARFEREARAAAAIQSPHVVHVQDLGVEEGIPYIVMELLRGEDLRSRLRRVGRLSMAETAGMLVQVGKALRRAHEAGIVHRDIKPGNLFLAQMDGDEVLKVLDFGIAKQHDLAIGDATQTGEIVGSPHYVSPEQARGEKDVDHRSDVWSVGVIAFRMITGQLPFPGEGMGMVLSKLLTQPPPPVRSIVPELPAALDSFFARALAKEREERFQTVRALVDAYMSLLRNEALEDSISPPSWSSIHNLSKPPEAPPASSPDIAIPRPAALPSLAAIPTSAGSATAAPTPATVIHPLRDAESGAPIAANPPIAPGGLPPGVTSTTGAMAAAAAMTSEAAMTSAAAAARASRAVMPSAMAFPGLDARPPSNPPSSGFDTLTPSVIPRLRPRHPARRAGLLVAVGAAIVGAGGAYLFATRPVVMPVEPASSGLPAPPVPEPRPVPCAVPAPVPTLAPSVTSATPPLGPPRYPGPAASSARLSGRLPGSAAPAPAPPPVPPPPSAASSSPPSSAWPFPSPGPTSVPSAIAPPLQPAPSGSARVRWGMGM